MRGGEGNGGMEEKVTSQIEVSEWSESGCGSGTLTYSLYRNGGDC